MGKKANRQGLSLGYRLGYRIRYLVLYVFGPAQLGEHNDPHARLRRERSERVEAARRLGDWTA